jgi:hypothetical protein
MDTFIQMDPRLRGDDAAMKRPFPGSITQDSQYRGGSWLVRSGCFDCLTEPGIVGGIVADRLSPP